ncbi:heme-thiolate peroxidase [Phellinidium pouzarii]|uniref:Heme-thiolate peroxidase n=1 Tax=Phellinidium pouzarii TaxID=167371 RepID=A0A4S4LBU5_9AGAM|nr:heme-thiolate peroxidase [Phellinidium pouzarii]
MIAILCLLRLQLDSHTASRSQALLLRCPPYKRRKPCPYASGESVHPYVAPGPDDSRSPCPALNTMANHAYLPRDGRRLTGTVLTHALMECYNLSWPLAAFLSWGGVLLLGQDGLFSLHDLARHNRIEHDASIAHINTPSDEEYAPANVDSTLYNAFLADAHGGRISARDIARARVRREAEKSTHVTAVQQEIARGEVALVLQVFGGESFSVPLDVIHSWWHDERLPEGWRPTRKTTLLGTIHWSTVIRDHMNDLRDRQPHVENAFRI